MNMLLENKELYIEYLLRTTDFTTHKRENKPNTPLEEKLASLYGIFRYYADESVSTMDLSNAMQANYAYYLNIAKFIKGFSNNNWPIYRFANTFYNHLVKSKAKIDLKFFTENLKDKVYYLEFPTPLLLYGSRKIYSCFCSMAKNISDDISVKNFKEQGFKFRSNHLKSSHLAVSFGSFGSESKEMGDQMHLLNIPLDKEEVEDLDTHSKEYETITNHIIKCILYIESAKPDLILEKPKRVMSARKSKRNKINLCPFNVTNVGYSFHEKDFHKQADKARYSYHIDEAPRIGHFRWQPCGEQRSKVKLIWIDETTIHYNKDK